MGVFTILKENLRIFRVSPERTPLPTLMAMMARRRRFSMFLALSSDVVGVLFATHSTRRLTSQKSSGEVPFFLDGGRSVEAPFKANWMIGFCSAIEASSFDLAMEFSSLRIVVPLFPLLNS